MLDTLWGDVREIRRLLNRAPTHYRKEINQKLTLAIEKIAVYRCAQKTRELHHALRGRGERVTYLPSVRPINFSIDGLSGVIPKVWVNVIPGRGGHNLATTEPNTFTVSAGMHSDYEWEYDVHSVDEIVAKLDELRGGHIPPVW